MYVDFGDQNGEVMSKSGGFPGRRHLKHGPTLSRILLKILIT